MRRGARDISFNRRTQAVQRAVDILKLFSLSEPELSLLNISSRLGIPLATAHRLIQTLDDESVLQRIERTDLYRLGPFVRTLAGQMMAQHPIQQVAAPYLRRLAHQLGLTVALSSYDNGSVIYLDCVEGSNPVALSLRSGFRVPAHCVASGRAMLAHLDLAELDVVCQRGLQPCSPTTKVTKRQLLQDLALIRKRQYAIDVGDYSESLRAAAAVIFDAQGQPVAGITTVGLASEVTLERLDEMGQAVKAMALEITQQIGGSAPAGG